MKKIIALQGKNSKGKSTTLKIFLKEILNKYSITAVEYELKNLTQVGILNSDHLETEIANENVALNTNSSVQNHTAIFEINSKKIGLTTYGDTQWHITHALDCLNDCDIIICACRTKGDGYNYLYDTYKDDLLLLGKATIWSLDKTFLPYLIDYTNAKQVEILWETLNKLL